MKHLFLLFGICAMLSTIAQEPELELLDIEEPVLDEKYFDNKAISINEILAKNIQYPARDIARHTQGTEIIKFEVTSEGRLTNFKIVNSLSREIDKEIFRVLRSTNGKWSPGTIEGIQVTMEKEISVNFFLGPEEFLVADAKACLQKGNKWMFGKNDPKKAIYFYNKGVKLLPYDETLLEARALCRYNIGDKRGGEKDRLRLIELARRNGNASDAIPNTYTMDWYYAKLDSMQNILGTK